MPSSYSEGTWPRLRGPTGFYIGHGYVLAYFVGIAIAGMRLSEALRYPDSGRSWLLANVAHNWNSAVADCINRGGVISDG